MKWRSAQSGFTLLELVLVMVVLCVAMAVIVPSFQGFSTSARFQDSATQIVALAQYARTQAVTEGRVYRLNLDPQAGSYWLTVQENEQFVALGTEFGRIFSLPDGTRLSLSVPSAAGKNQVDFFPSGRCDVARISLTDTRGREIQVGNLSPAELFQVLENPQGVRG